MARQTARSIAKIRTAAALPRRWGAAAAAAWVAACGIGGAAQAAPLDPNGYASLGTLNTAASLTFNTDTLAVSGGFAGTGVLQAQGPGLPDIAVFTFDDINVTGATSLTLTGSRPLALLSKGNAVIARSITISSFTGGLLGGQAGGSGGPINTAGSSGMGPGAGGGGAPGTPFGGGGGGSGGMGTSGGHTLFTNSVGGGAGGPAYGNLPLALQGGSGGGGGGGAVGPGGNGGAGGGAIEIIAIGTLQLTTVNANGGPMVAGGSFGGGGGGSGGAVVLQGSSIITGNLNVGGADGHGSGASSPFGGGGGGGRVYVAPDTYTFGQTPLPGVSINGGLTGNGTGQRAGTGSADLAPGLTIIPGGAALDIVSPQISQYQISLSGLQVDAGGLGFAAGAHSAAGNVAMQGGTLAMPGGLNFDGAKVLSGFGNVVGPVSGGAGNALDAGGGTLTVGDATSTDGFSWGGSTSIGAGATLQVQDADKAVFGSTTTIGDAGRLASSNGVLLGAGQLLTATGNAMVDGALTNQGTVNGPTGSGQQLTFVDDVDGAGGYTGNILFSDGFAPGNSPALVTFAGNAMFDGSALIEMELGGLTAGTDYDKIVVAGILGPGGGVLDIRYWDGFMADAGHQFDLFDWGSLGGTFGQINLPALSAGLSWDVSQLYADGTISVAAVPEPKTYVMLGIGLGLMGWVGRRK